MGNGVGLRETATDPATYSNWIRWDFNEWNAPWWNSSLGSPFESFQRSRAVSFTAFPDALAHPLRPVDGRSERHGAAKRYEGERRRLVDGYLQQLGSSEG